MDFAHIQQSWAQQPAPAPGGDQARIQQALKQARVLNRRVATRDYVELGTTVGMSGAFVWIGIVPPFVIYGYFSRVSSAPLSATRVVFLWVSSGLFAATRPGTQNTMPVLIPFSPPTLLARLAVSS